MLWENWRLRARIFVQAHATCLKTPETTAPRLVLEIYATGIQSSYFQLPCQDTGLKSLFYVPFEPIKEVAQGSPDLGRGGLRQDPSEQPRKAKGSCGGRVWA